MSGNELLLTRIANQLDPSIVEPHVCCLEDSPAMSSLDAPVRTAVFPLRSVFSREGLRQTLRFRRYLRTNGIRAVHSFENKTALFAVLAALGVRGVAVITSRLNCGYWYTPKLIRLFRAMNLFSTHILTNSAAGKQVVVDVEKVKPGMVTVFYPGVDLQRFSPRGGGAVRARTAIPAGVPVVGIVANFRSVKNLPVFVRAAALVAEAVPDTAFLLVGQGPLKEELRQLAADLGIGDRTYFSDAAVDVADYLATMSVACLSSDSEGLPNAIMEYMAAGLPVVATDVGGVSELVEDGVTGYLSPPGAPQAMAERIIELLRNPERSQAMGGRGRERALNEFDNRAATRRLEEFYCAAASEAGREIITTPPFTVPTDKK